MIRLKSLEMPTFNLGVPLRKMTLIKNIKGLEPFSQFLIHINTESLLVNCFEYELLLKNQFLIMESSMFKDLKVFQGLSLK